MRERPIPANKYWSNRVALVTPGIRRLRFMRSCDRARCDGVPYWLNIIGLMSDNNRRRLSPPGAPCSSTDCEVACAPPYSALCRHLSIRIAATIC